MAATPTGTTARSGSRAGTTGCGAFPRRGGRDRDVFRARRRGGSGRWAGRAGPSSPPSSRSATTRRSQRRAGARHRRPRDRPPSGSATPPIIPTTSSASSSRALRGEPWFARTLIVITGDHGFNVGEHGQMPGAAQSLPRIGLGAADRRRRPSPAAARAARPARQPARHRADARRPARPARGQCPGRATACWRPCASDGASRSDSAIRCSPRRGLWTARARSRRRPAAALTARARTGCSAATSPARAPALAEALLDRAGGAQRLNDYLLRHDRIWRNRAPRVAERTS